MRLRNGLFVHSRTSRFGVVPPSDQELMRRFLDETPFVFTGPEKWNALGLGTTVVFAVPRVYNKKRTGRFLFGNRAFDLRRVAFPESPPAEWFVVDLFENAELAGTSRASLSVALDARLRRGAFDRDRLRDMARRYGTKATQASVEEALRASA